MKNKQYLENNNFDSFEKIKSKKKKGGNDNDSFTNKNSNKKINVERGGKRYI